MRWIRFFSPLSGMGQMNLPVAPMAQVSRVRASAASSKFSGMENSALAGALSGSTNTYFGRSAGATSIQLVTGASSRHSPMGSTSTSRGIRDDRRAASSHATMAPKEWPASITSESFR